MDIVNVPSVDTAASQPLKSSKVAADPIIFRVALASIALLFSLSASYLWDHVWDQEAYAHGPIVAAIIAWLIWRRPTPSIHTPSGAELALGWLVLTSGLALFVVGRSQNIPVLDVSGLMPAFAGVLLVVGGWSLLRQYAFVLLFLFFLVPIPAFLLNMVTGPLKELVSVSAEALLFQVGYPIARSGVVLSIGQYQLLVADACSGLNSLFSLSAMGLLYLHLMNYRSFWRNALLIACIVPVAFAANLVRVMVLVLITYHLGDEAGQGFLHGFAGMFLFVLALLMLFLIDRGFGTIRALQGRSAETSMGL